MIHVAGFKYEDSCWVADCAVAVDGWVFGVGVSVMGGVAVARRWHARCHVQRVCQARSARIRIRRRYSGLATRPDFDGSRPRRRSGEDRDQRAKALNGPNGDNSKCDFTIWP